MKSSPKLSTSEAFVRITRYCAYQERAHAEVRDKLFSFGLHTDEVDELLTRLITEGFLNEERFARAFAGGKFRMKKWGRIKITHELEALRLSARCIRLGLQEIDDQDYRRTLETMLVKKMATLEEPNAFRQRDRAARHAIGKGYEPELVWKILKDRFPH